MSPRGWNPPQERLLSGLVPLRTGLQTTVRELLDVLPHLVGVALRRRRQGRRRWWRLDRVVEVDQALQRICQVVRRCDGEDLRRMETESVAGLERRSSDDTHEGVG